MLRRLIALIRRHAEDGDHPTARNIKLVAEAERRTAATNLMLRRFHEMPPILPSGNFARDLVLGVYHAPEEGDDA